MEDQVPLQSSKVEVAKQENPMNAEPVQKLVVQESSVPNSNIAQVDPITEPSTVSTPVVVPNQAAVQNTSQPIKTEESAKIVPIPEPVAVASIPQAIDGTDATQNVPNGLILGQDEIQSQRPAPVTQNEVRDIVDSNQQNNSSEHNVVVNQNSLNLSTNSTANNVDNKNVFHSEPNYSDEPKLNEDNYDHSDRDHLKLFVGGLYYQSENDIEDYFAQFGQIVSFQLLRHKQTGRSRGFAFVTMNDPTGSVKEQLLSRHNEIKGNYVDVKLAEDGKTRQNVEQNSSKVFVGGIEGSVTTEELKNFFRNYGAVKEAVVLKNINTNVSRGFGFVTFEDKDLADKLVAENNCIIKGKRMDIKWAEPKDSASQRNNRDNYHMGGGRHHYNDDYYHRMPQHIDPPVATIAPYAPPPIPKPSYNEPYYHDNRSVPPYQNRMHNTSSRNSISFSQDSYYNPPQATHHSHHYKPQHQHHHQQQQQTYHHHDHHQSNNNYKQNYHHQGKNDYNRPHNSNNYNSSYNYNVQKEQRYSSNSYVFDPSFYDFSGFKSSSLGYDCDMNYHVQYSGNSYGQEYKQYDQGVGRQHGSDYGHSKSRYRPY